MPTLILALMWIMPAPQDDGPLVKKLQAVKITAELEGADLESFLDLIRTMGGVNVVVDRDAPKAKVTLKVHDLSAWSALTIVCDMHGLGAVERDGLIYVTLREKLDRETVLELFDIRDLLLKIRDFPADEEGGAPPPPRNDDLGERILEIVRRHVAPGTWDGQSVELSIQNGILYVRHNRKVIREVKALVEKLRALK